MSAEELLPFHPDHELMVFPRVSEERIAELIEQARVVSSNGNSSMSATAGRRLLDLHSATTTSAPLVGVEA